MVPLVACAEEIAYLRRLIDKTAEVVFERSAYRLAYSVGTMIELPRAAICAETLAPYVDFVSFGTNDLTQMAFGFSRDDSRRFLDTYIDKEIIFAHPFLTIDRAGVGDSSRWRCRSCAPSNPASRSEYAVSTQAIQAPSTSLLRLAWITFPVRRPGCCWRN